MRSWTIIYRDLQRGVEVPSRRRFFTRDGASRFGRKVEVASYTTTGTLRDAKVVRV